MHRWLPTTIRSKSFGAVFWSASKVAGLPLFEPAGRLLKFIEMKFWYYRALRVQECFCEVYMGNLNSANSNAIPQDTGLGYGLGACNAGSLLLGADTGAKPGAWHAKIQE